MWLNQVDKKLKLTPDNCPLTIYCFKTKGASNHFLTIMSGVHASKQYFRTLQFYEFRTYCLKQDFTSLECRIVSRSGYVIHRLYTCSKSWVNISPYRQSISVPNCVEVTILTGVDTTVKCFAVSKMRCIAFPGQVRVCGGVRKRRDMYCATKLGSGMLTL